MSRTRTHQGVRWWVAALLLLPAAAQAQEGEVVVVPTGNGPALEATARVARSVMLRLNKTSDKRLAHMSYPFPRPLPPSRKQIRAASRALARARRAFDQMDYRRALTGADETRQLYKDLIKAGHPGSGYVEATHLLAAIAASDGKVKKAFKLMNDALLQDSRRPDKQRFSPPVQRLYDQVVAEPPARGTVKLSSKKPALIWFNNDLLGLARGKRKIRGGLYLVRVYAPGYVPLKRWIRVKPHQSRDLELTLNRDNSPEPPRVAVLRNEAWGGKPGPGVQHLMLEQAATQAILVTARKGCSRATCKLGLFWAVDDRFKRHKWLDYYGDPKALAFQFLKTKRPAVAKQRGGGKPGASPGAAGGTGGTGGKPGSGGAGLPLAGGTTLTACTLHSQCGMEQRCIDGRCQRPTPVTRKWWFWTIVGAVVAGTAVAIVVPVVTADHPVIEVR